MKKLCRIETIPVSRPTWELIGRRYSKPDALYHFARYCKLYPNSKWRIVEVPGNEVVANYEKVEV